MQRVQGDLPAAAGSRVSGRGGVVLKNINMGSFEQYERSDRTGLVRASAECLVIVIPSGVPPAHPCLMVDDGGRMKDDGSWIHGSRMKLDIGCWLMDGV